MTLSKGDDWFNVKKVILWLLFGHDCIFINSFDLNIAVKLMEFQGGIIKDGKMVWICPVK